MKGVYYSWVVAGRSCSATENYSSWHERAVYRWRNSAPKFFMKILNVYLTPILGGIVMPLRRPQLLGLIIGLMLLFPPTSFAINGRDFAGFYELRDVVDMGDQVSATLLLQPFNYSDADVYNATILVQDSLLLTTAHATFSSINLPDRGTTVLQSAITISKVEYDLWQQGAMPFVVIQYTDVQGIPRQRPIELIPMIVGGGL